MALHLCNQNLPAKPPEKSEAFDFTVAREVFGMRCGLVGLGFFLVKKEDQPGQITMSLGRVCWVMCFTFLPW